MFGKAAMIAVLLAPTASIATHDDHRTEPVRWLNVAMSSVRHRADETRAAAQRIVVYELPLNLARGALSDLSLACCGRSKLRSHPLGVTTYNYSGNGFPRVSGRKGAATRPRI